MSIDVKKALAASIPTQQSSWDQDDVILYHLGIGAGVGKATDAKELEYTYEKSLKVLPSFAVIPVTSSLASLTHVPGININSALLLHGEQEVEIHRPLPVTAEIESSARIAGIYDKGKAALIVLEVKTRLKAGEPLFTNRFSLFARGEGGFGGDPGPRPGSETPARKPDAVVETSTVPHQPLLYRLSGDKNPLHVDPSFARRGGFDTPILHGLCSFGIVCKAVVDALLDGDVTRVERYRVRFAGVAYPGETIVTSMWRENGEILLAAMTKERSSPVLSNSAIRIRS